MRLFFFLLNLFFVSSLANVAISSENNVSGSPLLRINSAFNGSLFDMDVDENAKYVVTSSSDGIAAVWDLETKSKPVIFRAPYYERQRTRTAGVAIHPNGNLLALSLPPLAAKGNKIMAGTARIIIFDRVNNKRIRIPGTKRDGLKIPVASSKLKFSPDGKFLFSLLSRGCGIRIWRTDDWTLFASEDKSFLPPKESPAPYCALDIKQVRADELRNFSNYSIVFHKKTANPDVPVWFTVSGSSGLISFKYTTNTDNIDGISPTRFASPKKLGLIEPHGAAIDSSKQRIVVGDSKKSQVVIVDANSLEPLENKLFAVDKSFIRKQDRHKLDTHLAEVAWIKHDGKEKIISGGYLSYARFSIKGAQAVIDPSSKHRQMFGDYSNSLVMWEPEKSEIHPQFIAYGNNTIMSLKPLNKGENLLVGASNSIGTVNLLKIPLQGDGSQFLGRKKALDWRNGWLLATKDGHSLYLKNYIGSEHRRDISFNLKNLRLSLLKFNTVENDKEIADFFRREKFQWQPEDFLKIAGDYDSWTKNFSDGLPQFFSKDFSPNNKLFDLSNIDRSDRSRSVAVSNDKKYILWGSSNALRLVRNDEEYANVICSLPLRHEAHAVTFAGEDKNLAIVLQSDGAIRWYEINNRDSNCKFYLRLTVYMELNDDYPTWVAFRPDGYYYASHLDKGLAGWQQNDDSFNQVGFYELTKFVSKYYNTKKIQESLDLSQKIEPVSRPGEISDSLLPDYQVELVNTEKRELIDTDLPLKLILKINFSQRASDLLGLKFWVNGELVDFHFDGDDYGIHQEAIVRKSGEYEFKLHIPYSGKEVHGPLKIHVEYGSEKFRLRDKLKTPIFENFSWSGTKVAKRPRRIKAILVGLSDYKDPKYSQLNFAHQDAIDMAKILLNDFQNQIYSSVGSTRQFVGLDIKLVLSRKLTTLDKSLIKSINNQVQTLHENGYKDEIKFKFWSVQQADNAPGGKNTRDKVNTLISEIVKDLKAKSATNYRDIVLLLLSGHGLSKFFNSNPEPDFFLVTPEAPFYGDDEGSFRSRSINIDSLLKPLSDLTNVEKIIILDACRNIPDPDKNDINIKAFNQLGKTLKDGILFLSADAGELAYGLSYELFPRRYRNPYNELDIPNNYKGNSVFFHSFLAAMHCPDAIDPRRNIFDIDSMRYFLSSYYRSDTEVMNELKKQLKLGHVPVPYLDVRAYKDTKYWFRPFDTNQSSQKECIILVPGG